mmetsp:Transcript_50019/g.79678  ORF Transcript_50019/g.79678 Transcript_50019/m.79678 type:complete len:664 (+) Transcript_50019:54-2045(+)
MSALHSLYIVPLLFTSLINACSNSAAIQTCTVCLSQSDFAAGTYRITDSGTYCLKEDIVFDPNPGDLSNPNEEGAWLPADEQAFPGSTQQLGGAFALGFFSVITIETSDVTLDLSRHSIEFSFSFYLQQRFAAIIEISNQPFLPGFGPADFGAPPVGALHDITVQNGHLRLSSHHSLRAHNVSNLHLAHLSISDFEVAGIQLNAVSDALLEHIDIGPSLNYVPLSGYYSHSRFLSIAYRRLLAAINEQQLAMPTISFSYMHPGESVSIQQVFENLIDAMDLVFRELSGDQLTTEERESEIYQKATRLFRDANPYQLPDGSAQYGILLNSHSVATHGFGDARNDQEDMGRNISMKEVSVHHLQMATDEVPAMYFDQCTSPETSAKSLLRGPFGDVINIRLMLSEQHRELIDNFDVMHGDIANIKYLGNPLADAQIALYLYGEYPGDGTNYAFRSFVDAHFLQWALNENGYAAAPFPTCVQFVCNGDVMFHTNKGIVGVRLDGIEDAKMEKVSVKHLTNKSPLSLCTCGDYTGSEDGGHPGTRAGEGAMKGDVRGISLFETDLLVNSKKNRVASLRSYFGDVTGIDLMNASLLEYEGCANIRIQALYSATRVTTELYEELLDMNKTPYPNNFLQCTMRLSNDSMVLNAKKGAVDGTDCVLPSFAL